MTSCTDCPDLGGSRPTCCRDDYISARATGAFPEGAPELPAMRKAMDDRALKASEVFRGRPAEFVQSPPMNRKARRAASSKRSKD